MTRNQYELLSRRPFYYIKVEGLATKRDNIILDLLDEDVVIKYYSVNSYATTVDLLITRYWKSEKTARDFGRKYFKGEHTIMTMKPKEFIDMFEKSLKDVELTDEYKENHIYQKNIRYLETEKQLQGKIKNNKHQYKCIDAYESVTNYDDWAICPNCKLKPLVWDFNNGSSTACGCGESIYNHFSIESESIMSYIKRNDGSALNYPHNALQNNWNHWVRTGEVLFDRKKESELNDKW